MSPDHHHSIRVAISRLPGASSVGLAPASPEAVVRNPLIDIHEEPERLVLQADLPGVTEHTLTVQLEENVLSLRAEVPSTLPDDAKPLLEEFRPGVFARSFILSDEVDRSKIEAALNNGVLELILPKADRARPRRIEVKST